ncbi:type II toxin-antitoxin system HicB family antitoxin [Petrimonas sp.]|uniref:type II toxin-antitoxin system HicB family antitoxin n=1 Tax=Petrimonas sp. TaxID=2023866 RepID=UPI003F51298B
MNFTAIITETNDKWYVAQCEELPEALTQGKSLNEAIENLKDAILLILDVRKQDAQKEYDGQKVIRRKIAIA